jgi:hypothetical protein
MYKALLCALLVSSNIILVQAAEKPIHVSRAIDMPSSSLQRQYLEVISAYELLKTSVI